MLLQDHVRRMPKVELHVHLEGSIRPETVLKLAARNGVELPAKDLDGLREWYKFRDFAHFVEIYLGVSRCVKTAEDLELVAREFLEGQAAQNVLHTEATYTASTMEKMVGIPWADQIAALRRARKYGDEELGVSCDFILDIVRGNDPAWAMDVARWCVEALGDGVCALGLAGPEGKQPAAFYAEAFALAKAGGVPIIPHAGETQGPESIWDALRGTDPVRIAHGVRCLEDPELVAELRDRQIPLDVCPSSNVGLGVFPSLDEHPLPRLLDEGLSVNIGSDDPPMFGTTITDEYLRVSEAFDFGPDILWSLTLNAANASLLPAERKRALVARLREGFSESELDEDDPLALTPTPLPQKGEGSER